MPEFPLDEFVLPGADVYPEGITEGGADTFYVGSLDHGTVYRGGLDQGVAEVWLPGSLDGRTSVAGLHVDRAGRLVVCGFATRHVFVYELASGALIARRTVPASGALINDVFVVGDTAYLTDSNDPLVWALPLGPGPDSAEIGEPTVFCDLGKHGLAEPTFLNGIVATADGSALLVSDQEQDELWRIELGGGRAERVELGSSQFCADGMVLLEPDLLLGVSNRGATHDDVVFSVSAVRSDNGWASAWVAGEHRDPRWNTPTTLAVVGGRVLVVDAQLRARPTPTLPFRVLDVGSVAEVVSAKL